MDKQFLSVLSSQIVDTAGNSVPLRGYNVGGLMNMENFLTGYPSSETNSRKTILMLLERSAANSSLRPIWTRFYSDDDAAYLASLE